MYSIFNKNYSIKKNINIANYNYNILICLNYSDNYFLFKEKIYKFLNIK